jgi:hypothetical protein
VFEPLVLVPLGSRVQFERRSLQPFLDGVEFSLCLVELGTLGGGLRGGWFAAVDASVAERVAVGDLCPREGLLGGDGSILSLAA